MIGNAVKDELLRMERTIFVPPARMTSDGDGDEYNDVHSHSPCVIDATEGGCELVLRSLFH